MPGLPELTRRLTTSTVAWSWAFNFLRLASGLLLLPLLLRMLPETDLGMYYGFLNLFAITTVLDFGIGPTLGRFVSYAMGGATRLTAHGLADDRHHSGPNYRLVWELVFTARAVYRILSVITLLLLGTLGSWVIGNQVAETTAPMVTWVAWGICALSAACDLYFSFWNTFLRSLNHVLAAQRIMVFAYALRLALACGLLLAGGGLLSVPVATLSTSVIIFALSRRACHALLPAGQRPQSVSWRTHFSTVWPNTWRLGLYFTGAYLGTQANGLICLSVLGAAANATYGLTFQVVTITGGLATVWTQVKWPLIGQLVSRRDTGSIREVLWPRLWLVLVTYLPLALGALLLGPQLLLWLGSTKTMLPALWCGLMLLNGFLEQHCSNWNTLIALGNRLPMLWPSLITNALGLGINLALVHQADALPGWLALGPLLAGLAFNYWYWPRFGARTLDLSWLEFMRYGFRRRAARN
jgi:O-antigen/teichoic acid export membrane protein